MRDASAAVDAAVAREWLAGAARLLQEQRSVIDDLNVFPVPDGDTGTNLAATFASAATAAELADDADGAEAILRAATRAAVMDARGNSGVIASQFVRGFAENIAAGDPASIAACLKAAAELAEAAIGDPRDGTMLTVMQAAVPAQGATVAELVTDAVRLARTALIHTPEQLPELARAGVVDAGGQGIVVVLEALMTAVTGVDGTQGRIRTPRSARALRMAREEGSPDFAFEVQYLLDCADPEADQLRSDLATLGDSVVLVGTGTGTWNVHVHVNDVGAAIEAGIERGQVRRISVIHFLDDLGDEDGVLLVALAPPEGLAGLFEAEGVQVVTGAELQDAVGTHRRVILLAPTGAADVEIAVAEIRDAGAEVAVVPTRSPLQALSAIAVHDEDRRFQDDVIAMAEAAAATRFAEVRIAEDDALTTIGPCRRGDVLGLIDGEVVHIGASVDTVALVVTDRLLGTGGELITVLLGADWPSGSDDLVKDHVGRVSPFTEVVVYAAGQHECPLMIGME